MLSYYTSIMILVWLTLGTLCLLVVENNRLARSDKRLLCLTCVFLAVSSFAEWAGVNLEGRADSPAWLLRLAKFADLTFTPMAGGMLILQTRPKGVWRGVLIGVLAANTVFQIISVFTGWMIVFRPDNTTANGPLYAPCIFIQSLSIITVLFVSFIEYGRAFRRQNRLSLYAIMLLIVIGIAMQEALPGGRRTSFLTLTIGAALMFIHCAEFSSLRLDEQVEHQQIQIDTDALTGVSSRYAYNMALVEYEKAGAPADLAAVSIDINGLKRTNDTLGHAAGDELIRGAADCIRGAFGEKARCYRTGGDEFVILAEFGRGETEAAMERLRRAAAGWRGDRVRSMSLSAGFAVASEHPDMSAERLIREADLAMYSEKARYYSSAEHDRRKHNA